MNAHVRTRIHIFGAMLSFCIAFITPVRAGDRIAFVSDRDGNDEIYVMNADGSSQVQLTNNATGDGDVEPAWSPDSTKIAFTSHRNGDENTEIYVMNADGTDQRRLTNNLGHDYGPTWSPDGSKIAYVREHYKINVMNADGSGQTTIYQQSIGAIYSLDWSPNGAKIAFDQESDDILTDIFTINADGSGVTRIATGGLNPSWSPDGTRIAFAFQSIIVFGDGISKLYVVDADGSNRQEVRNGLSRNPSWSPDGTRIAFDNSVYLTGNTEILALDPNGPELVNLTNSAAKDYDPDWASSLGPGSLDPTFGADGITTAPKTDSPFGAAAVAIQPDGKIVAAGSNYNGFFGHVVVSRYNKDGTLDNSFGLHGQVTTEIGGYSSANAVAIQPDGKIVAAGFSGLTGPGASRAFALVRYNADGSLDPSFDFDGILTTDFGGFSDSANAVIIQTDGKIVVAGTAGIGSGGNFALARYNQDGSLDASFDTDGRVTAALDNNNNGGAFAVAVQAGGKIVVAGRSSGCFALARFQPDGSLDAAFDTDGRSLTHCGLSINDGASAIALQPDGKIVVAGTRSIFDVEGNIKIFTLLRYGPNGTPDTSFRAGEAIPTAQCVKCIGKGVAVQKNGRIVAAVDSGGGFAIFRYDTEGSPDDSFGQKGRVITRIASAGAVANAVAIQPDGKIVAAGFADGGFTIARYIGDTAQQRHTRFDFDGDGKSDISVFRPANNTWYFSLTQNGFTFRSFGIARDVPTPADFDGDGKTDIAVWRPSDGKWYVINSGLNTFVVQSWGAKGDIPVPGDFDGDAKADRAVFRPTDGKWYVLTAGNSIIERQFGELGDKPQIGDFDGDSKEDLAVFRPSTNIWYLLASGGTIQTFKWGVDGDIPVPADFNGDGRTDIATFRPSSGEWLVLTAAESAVIRAGWGQNGDIPAPADYDGDGKSDFAVFRPSTGTWWLKESTAGFSTQLFGNNGDRPLANAYGR